MSKSAKQVSLDQIKAEITSSNVCPDLALEATQLVFGDGSPEAEIMFVGEAPGKNEDILGLPFVGAAGKFLDEMLVTADLKRSEVYITNIVKYRPPNNRDPLPEEKQAFLPYLLKQIAVIKPKLLVTLGRHSMEYFLPGMKISEVHGRAFRKTLTFSITALLGVDTRKSRATDRGVLDAHQKSSGSSDEVDAREARQNDELVSSTGLAGKVVILPLFHPAAALYNGSMRQTLIEDFGRIPKILKNIK